MKLYNQVCFGLIFVFFCNTEQSAVVSDFCKQTAPLVRKLARLSDAELANLERRRIEAIVDLRNKYARLCPS